MVSALTGSMTDALVLLGVLFVAYLIRGVTGFGSGLLAVPILAHFMPLQVVVPVVMTMDFLASFILGGVGGKDADWGEIYALIPFGLIGAMLGAYALIRFPSQPVILALGAFTLFFGARNAIGVVPRGRISKLWAVPAGLVGSSARALFGTSGPPYIVYLTHRLDDKRAVRATFSWLFVIDGGVRVALFLLAGLFLPHQTQIALAMAVAPMLLGLFVGNRLHLRASREAMVRAVGLILVLSGASLIVRGLA